MRENGGKEPSFKYSVDYRSRLCVACGLWGGRCICQTTDGQQVGRAHNNVLPILQGARSAFVLPAAVRSLPWRRSPAFGLLSVDLSTSAGGPRVGVSECVCFAPPGVETIYLKNTPTSFPAHRPCKGEA